VVRGNDANHYDFGVILRDGRPHVFLREVLAGKVVEPIQYAAIPPGEVELSIVARPLEYEFFYQPVGNSPKSIGSAATKDVSSEKIGGFTGVYFGLYATGNGKPSSVPADFNWFDYEVVER
jgi:alpha-N-arabinofuranosidase